MQRKKIIKLPKYKEINYVFDVHELHDLLEQTFNAGVNWKEKYYINVNLKDSCPSNCKQPSLVKYLKQIQNER